VSVLNSKIGSDLLTGATQSDSKLRGPVVYHRCCDRYVSGGNVDDDGVRGRDEADGRSTASGLPRSL